MWCHAMWLERLLILMAASMAVSTAAASISRIHHVVYSADKVVTLSASSLTSTQVIFSPSETIQSIQCGDMAAWMVHVDARQPSMFFIKPTLLGSHTNMTVVSNKHSYYFKLISEPFNAMSQADQPFAIQFSYPQSKTIKPKVAKPHHGHYSFSGDPSLKPRRVFDDGRFVRMVFYRQQSLPAVFAVDNRAGEQAMVNWRVEGNSLVIDHLAPQYILRRGRHHVACVFNTDWINTDRGVHG